MNLQGWRLQLGWGLVPQDHLTGAILKLKRVAALTLLSALTGGPNGLCISAYHTRKVLHTPLFATTLKTEHRYLKHHICISLLKQISINNICISLLKSIYICISLLKSISINDICISLLKSISSRSF